MKTNDISEVLVANWKVVVAAVMAVLVLAGGFMVWRDRQQAWDQAASNALYEAQAQAREFVLKKQYAEAEKVYAPLFEKFPGSRAAYEGELQVGDFWTDGKNFDQAVVHYEKAVRIASDAFSRVLAKYNLGIAQESAGKYQDAVSTYEETQKLDGSDFLRPEVMMAEARCYEALKEPKKAIELYKAVQEKYASRSYYSGAASAFEKQLTAKRL
jgi:tetratricopeptide (TPR) repeat protein